MSPRPEKLQAGHREVVNLPATIAEKELGTKIPARAPGKRIAPDGPIFEWWHTGGKCVIGDRISNPVSHHAAAQPRNVMNSSRLTLSPRQRGRAAWLAR